MPARSKGHPKYPRQNRVYNYRQWNDYYGHKRIGHGGAIGGFRSQIQTFPEDELSIVILTNFSSGNPGGNLNRIANIILDITPDARQPRDEKKELPYQPNTSDLKALDGLYYSPELHTIYELRANTGELVAYHSRHGEMSTSWISEDEIQVRGALGKIAIIKSKKGKVTGFKASNGRVRNLWFEKQ